ncbi:MAG: hypothetical protein K6F93_08700 [Lachnospiraceae bacterium]|nr:hypothetical protein [Lachnospiraceae bacterium]
MRDDRKVKLAVICFLIAVPVILAVIFATFFRLEKVEVVNTGSYYSDEEIEKRLLNGFAGKFTYIFALKAKIKGIDDIPFIEKTDYEIVDKNTLRLYVYERQIAGSVPVMGKYFCFDREGIVTDCVDALPEGVVLVTGIDIDDIVIGKKIGSDNEKYASLMEIVSLLNKNGIETDEISFDFRGNITLMIGDDEVILGDKEDYDLEINNLKNIMASMGEGAFRFDMRYMNSENMSVTAKPIDN